MWMIENFRDLGPFTRLFSQHQVDQVTELLGVLVRDERILLLPYDLLELLILIVVLKRHLPCAHLI